jgi:hypothetical protein
MDCLDTLEIAYVELTGIVLFREENGEGGGIMAYQVYAVQTEDGIIVIRCGRGRNKKIGMKWIKEHTESVFKPPSWISRTECIKFLIKEIKIKKVYWKHKISVGMLELILRATKKSQEIYDYQDNIG